MIVKNNEIEITIDLEKLPSPPGVAVRLLEIFDKNEVDKDELIGIISADMALTAKILSYCNSPLLGRSQQIDSLGPAVVILGLKKVRTLALSFSLLECKSEDDSEFDYEEFWTKSLATAVASQVICDEEGENSELAFVVGLVANIGRVIIENQFSDQDIYPATEVTEVRKIIEFEEKRIGTNRFILALELLQNWTFPESIVQTIRELGSSIDDHRFNHCINLGMQFSSLFFMADQDVSLSAIEQIREYSESVLKNQAFEDLFDASKSRWTDFSAMLEFDAPSATSLRELENEARNRIVSFSLSQIDEQKIVERENQELKSQSLTDQLTGLKNRRAMDMYLDVEFEQAVRGVNLCIAMVDIDFFKKINDTHGHLIGDQVLTHVASVLKENVRSADVVIRFGGEEFCILMTNCDLENAVGACERLRSKVEENPLFVEGETIPMTISIGVSSYEANPVSDWKSLIENADKQLYQAKNNGRNRCEPQAETDC